MGWLNERLQAQTTDTVDLVWSDDPAVLYDEKTAKLISAAEASCNGQPDVFVCRPLNSAETVRLGEMVRSGMGAQATVEAAYLGVVEIRPAGAKPVIGSEIRTILREHCPAELLASLGAHVFGASRKGVDDLPFRTGGAKAPG